MIKVNYTEKLTYTEVKHKNIPTNYIPVSSCEHDGIKLTVYCDSSYYNNETFIKLYEGHDKKPNNIFYDPFGTSLAFYGTLCIGWPRYIINDSGNLTLKQLELFIKNKKDSLNVCYKSKPQNNQNVNEQMEDEIEEEPNEEYMFNSEQSDDDTEEISSDDSEES